MMLRVPSVTMNGGILSRVTSAPLRKPKAEPQMRPSGKARIVGTPSSTARRPITTDEMTMMTPIDRSMPGGEDHQGLTDAENAGDHHLGQNGRDVAGGGETRRIDRHSEQQAERQHDEWDGRRVDMQEALKALKKGETLFVEGGDRRRRRRSAPSRIPAGAGRPAGDASLMASSLVSRLFLGVFVKPALRSFRPRAPSPMFVSRLSSERRAKSTPAELHALVDGDRGNARALDGR